MKTRRFARYSCAAMLAAGLVLGGPQMASAKDDPITPRAGQPVPPPQQCEPDDGCPPPVEPDCSVFTVDPRCIQIPQCPITHVDPNCVPPDLPCDLADIGNKCEPPPPPPPPPPTPGDPCKPGQTTTGVPTKAPARCRPPKVTG